MSGMINGYSSNIDEKANLIWEINNTGYNY